MDLTPAPPEVSGVPGVSSYHLIGQVLTEYANRDYDYYEADFKNLIKKDHPHIAYHMFIYNTKP